MKKSVSTLRAIQNYYLQNHVATLPDIKTVLNAGALPDDKDKQGLLYQNYFKGKEYFTLDKNRNSISANHFHIDLHDMKELFVKKFDLILIMAVLEHVENPFIVCKNIQELLNPKGYIFVSVPFFYPIHKDPRGRFSDYWRFTDDAIKLLFEDMELIWIKSAPSLIKSVSDRVRYWNDKNRTISGICALFRKI
jgi:SAM-dependent methyltransferase